MIGSMQRLLFKRVPLCVEANSCTCSVGRTSTNGDDEEAAARSSLPHRLVSTEWVACLGRFAGGDGTRRFEWPLELVLHNQWSVTSTAHLMMALLTAVSCRWVEYMRIYSGNPIGALDHHYRSHQYYYCSLAQLSSAPYVEFDMFQLRNVHDRLWMYRQMQ